MSKKTEYIREQIRRLNMYVHFAHKNRNYTKTAASAYVYYKNDAVRVGSIYYTYCSVSDTVEITGMSTSIEYRRLGVATFIFREMLKCFKIMKVTQITTPSGTDKSRPWLRKMGFVRYEDWELNL